MKFSPGKHLRFEFFLFCIIILWFNLFDPGSTKDFFFIKLWKECLNSDDQLFHQYKKKDKQINSHLKLLNTKSTTTYDIGHPGPVMRLAQKWGRVKEINGIPIHPFDNWISNDNADIDKPYKNLHRSSFTFTWKRPHTQMNDNIYSTIFHLRSCTTFFYDK